MSELKIVLQFAIFSMAQKDQKRTRTTIVFPEKAKNKHLLTELPYFVCNYSIQH